ncbi:MAG: uL30 family ribosomal protein [Candidatus Aenigmarchaeota archaeon]|nr:uL30 family ribosomal protein [Candidatus Aenigmarchaeota archaeon]
MKEKRIVIVRMRGTIGVDIRIRKTLDLLRLKRRFSASVFDDSPSIRGMIKNCQGYVAWGEVNDETETIVATRKLSPPRGGINSKYMHPKGDLGYRGDKINELVKRMI